MCFDCLCDEVVLIVVCLNGNVVVCGEFGCEYCECGYFVDVCCVVVWVVYV